MTSGRLPRMAEFGLTLVRHGETRYNKEKILQGQGVDEPLSETGFRQANAAGIFLSHVKFTHVFASDLLRAKQGGIDICELNEINTSDGQLPVRLRESDLPKATSRVIERGKNQTGDLLNLRHLLQLHLVHAYSEVSPIEFNGTYSQTTASILGKSQFCKEIAVKYDARLRERKYGVAEGRPLSDLKTMAKAAGEQCPSFTPPGGETLDEVKARGKDFFEYLCHLVTQEARQGKQTTPRTAENGTGAAEGRSSTSLTNHHQGLECCSDGAAEVLDANILVVSHGAYMRNWIGYFVSDLECRLPATLTKTELSSVSPNTGISQFTVKLENRDSIKPEIYCLCLNRDDHLSGMTTEKI